ncbi:glutamate synthase subunit beta [Streptomyces violaceusniger]|uniref:Glutamate synthase, NADH/NADPH, small subunit n=1 Tax=Streptomyces violaceusniger (strain Tu 4113) TaxID=653045 RepID=G2P4J8_STRV4|nr:glutamate synthase subunit beta [Streptomyces violaceusniger]AEM83736.1 glutamate synthase, NADH/NADPH, small subunit [Streptomyces violaceusniger Tu 4113]
MADPKGFLTTPRRLPPRRPVDERVRDWNEVQAPGALLPIINAQADRCMDCGIPFCHDGCPLGNLIPEWNDLVSRDDWLRASERLHATNNFPEFTGRLCPAPCESACVLAINQPAVTIKNVEVAIADRAWESGYMTPKPPERLSGRTVAVIGSGPAGLAAAQQLTRAGHTVAVYERDDRVGGLLRYGIPEFKMEKRHLDRRLGQMRAEGTKFRSGVDVGTDLDAAELRARYDALVIAVGARAWRELPVPGRELAGIHQAMEYLPMANRVREGDYARPPITAEGKHVVIVGGGDTGADCLGTVLRQGAASVTQLDIHPRPGDERADGEPWPTYPKIYRMSAAHEEARELAASPEADVDARVFSAATVRFEGTAPDAERPQGGVRALRLIGARADGQPGPDTERVLRADLVLLALGFHGPEPDSGLFDQLGLELDEGGTVARDASFATGADGVFVAGDAGRGQSLIVWAIAEGRSAAAAVDRYLAGSTTLPAPVGAADRPMTA